MAVCQHNVPVRVTGACYWKRCRSGLKYHGFRSSIIVAIERAFVDFLCLLLSQLWLPLIGWLLLFLRPFFKRQLRNTYRTFGVKFAYCCDGINLNATLMLLAEVTHVC